MRHILLVLLALLALAVPVALTGCAAGCGPTAEPVMELKSPIWFRSQPTLQPQGYAIQVQQQAACYQQVQQIQAPAPAIRYQYMPAAMPGAYDCGGEQPYSPPPVPPPVNPDDPPESIPAGRR